MTHQKLFTTVRNHLLTQMERSEGRSKDHSVSGITICLYRGPRGLKCAVGVLIPDEKYKPELEGKRITAEEVKIAAGLPTHCMFLAEKLQAVHDDHPPTEWKTKLDGVAEFFRLKVEEVSK